MPADTAREKSLAGTRNVTGGVGSFRRQLSGRSGRHAHGHHHPVHRRCRLRRFRRQSESRGVCGHHGRELTGFVATARTRPWISPGRRAPRSTPRFNVYRSTSSAGPFVRLTSSLIAGLGNSPQGARYSYTTPGSRTARRTSICSKTWRRRAARRNTARARDAEGGRRWPRPRRAAALAALAPRAPPTAIPRHVVPYPGAYRPLRDRRVRTGGFYATPQGDGTFHLGGAVVQDVAAPARPPAPSCAPDRGRGRPPGDRLIGASCDVEFFAAATPD